MMQMCKPRFSRRKLPRKTCIGSRNIARWLNKDDIRLLDTIDCIQITIKMETLLKQQERKLEDRKSLRSLQRKIISLLFMQIQIEEQKNKNLSKPKIKK
jgi:hypothetical protein